MTAAMRGHSDWRCVGVEVEVNDSEKRRSTGQTSKTPSRRLLEKGGIAAVISSSGMETIRKHKV